MSATHLNYSVNKPTKDHYSKPNTLQPPVDLIQKVTGAFGRYQLYITLLVFLSKFFVVFHHMAIVFLSPKISFTCNGVRNQCPCSNPVYDTSPFTRTIVTEWDLICERKMMESWAQSIFQVGVLLGSIFFGMASDRFGRKNPLLFAVVVVIAAGIGTAFAKNYYLFALMRLLTGASTGGTMVVGFVLLLEYVGKEYREVISALYQVPFNLGHMMMPGIAYYNRDYVDFQLCISVPAASMFCYFCLMPESARWLITVKRPEEGIQILTKAAKINHLPTDTIRADVEAFWETLRKTSVAKKGNITDLFRTPNLRKNIIAMAFNWLTCSYCFYGISQYMGQMSGDIFANVAIGATFTLGGTLLSIPLMKIIGRKTILIVFNFICAVCLVCLAFVGTGIIKVIFASIGQVSSFIVFVVVYLYCSELFPTVVRNAAVGLCSMMARVGSVIAPFVIYVQDPKWLPPLLFAILPFLATLITFLLPETKGCELMNTIEEGEAFGKKKKDPEKS